MYIYRSFGLRNHPSRMELSITGPSHQFWWDELIPYYLGNHVLVRDEVVMDNTFHSSSQTDFFFEIKPNRNLRIDKVVEADCLVLYNSIKVVISLRQNNFFPQLSFTICPLISSSICFFLSLYEIALLSLAMLYSSCATLDCHERTEGTQDPIHNQAIFTRWKVSYFI